MTLKAVLIFVGAAFMLAGVAAWVDGRDAGSSTVTETYTRETFKESSEPAETTEEAQISGQPSPPGPGSTTKTTTTGETQRMTVTRPSRKTTKTVTSSAASDSIVLGLLGFGSAFVLAGAFYDRITAFKFPGGEVTLREGTQKLEEALAELEQSQAALKDAVLELYRRMQGSR
jgi:hypothetical protein